MEKMRKPFQGTLNIIRFNWHFYVSFILLFTLIFSLNNLLYNSDYKLFINLILIPISIVTLSSLIVSFYIYDCSDLYDLKFLSSSTNPKKIANINAGFDEVSTLVQSKFPRAELTVFDFYNERKHTEISIKRARKAYPPFPGTVHISTGKLPSKNEQFDLILNILSAHEIRNSRERIAFFREQKRVLKSDGKIVVTEHLRDLPNFCAYTIGFFHFHSKNTWMETFRKSGLEMEKEVKITPFISTFILKKNGNSS